MAGAIVLDYRETRALQVQSVARSTFIRNARITKSRMEYEQILPEYTATAPLATLVLDRRAMAAIGFLDRAELIDGVTALVAMAKSPDLREARVFDLTGSELPWKDLGIILANGQEVTFLLGGRVWLAREQDLWVEPGVAFHVRTRGARPMFDPMSNTGTMAAAADGPLEMARSLVEFKDADGGLAGAD